ncbi:protein of unknown function [Algoriphagus faecimaris]|uniref:DUF4221 domain-containing protein n=1 Tax=Algoriphagus faecimaris TaxID=686796 RepID=A0A1G6P3X6_9BACT|nr:DUF4221 family protein [Algoriphagus faecimaris]SDC74651.1 protein of unknown function [Algoriphagus faecimaris]
MKKKLLFLLALGHFSCSEIKTASDNPLDYITDTTSISIDLKVDPYTRTLQYLDGDLYWWNANRQTISIFDLSKKTIKKSIKLEQEGPNGLGMPLGFFVVNNDSIYIPTMAYQFALINGEGRKLSQYDYFNDSKLGGVFVSMTRFSNTVQADGNGEYFFLMGDLKNILPSELNEEALKNYPPIFSFNQKKEEFDYLEFKAPKSLLRFNNSIDFGLAATSNSLLLINDQSNTLFEIDFNGFDYKEFTLKSDLIQNFSNEYWNAPRMSQSPSENINLLYKSSINLGVVFDPYNNLLFRFGWPGEDISNDEDAMKFGYTPRYFIISIYDGKDYTLIKELTLPRNTYLSHHYFINEKGLNLFPMHPDNPSFEEDKLVFHTFNFASLR